MEELLERFRGFTTEYLLERRALGDELSDDAHRAIEIALSERGVDVPPKPLKPIFSDDVVKQDSSIGIFKALGWLIVVAVGWVVSKLLEQTWLGIVLAVGIGVYLLNDWMRRNELTESEREAEDVGKKVVEDGLNILMQAAAEGDVVRVRELLDYGADVNARSYVGSTALMYAARNNHMDVAKLLIDAGAEVGVRSKKGSTAIDIAKRVGNVELAKVLIEALNRSR